MNIICPRRRNPIVERMAFILSTHPFSLNMLQTSAEKSVFLSEIPLQRESQSLESNDLLPIRCFSGTVSPQS